MKEPIIVENKDELALAMEALEKINTMKEANGDPVVFMKKGARRPKWLIDVCERAGVKFMRSKYVKKMTDIYLIDMTRAGFKYSAMPEIEL